MKPSSDRKLLAGILILAALIRFAGLGSHLPLWCDELASLQRLALPFTQHLRAMQGNHPLYEILLRFCMPLHGSDLRMRIPSAILGVFAVWLTWRLLRSVGRKEALLASALIALAPLHLMYSRIARPYALACVLALLSNISFLWAIKRRRALPLIIYAFTTALMIYSNLLAGSIWVAQGLFLLWFYRRRLRRLLPWIAANLCVGLLILPWMMFSLKGAVAWSQETTYTAQQLGKLYKIAHVAMALCVGETVHPLNPIIVPAAILGFGAAMFFGIHYALKRRRGIPAFLAVQALVGFAVALYFAAAAPKHVTTLLPAWFGLMAVGLVHARRKKTAILCACLIGFSMLASDLNYAARREFADADMVTPWRAMAKRIEKELPQSPNTARVLIGYQPDRGAFDMFNRYKPEQMKTEPLDFTAWQAHISHTLQNSKSLVLLLHDGDPWEAIETWLARKSYSFQLIPFQEEEHTLKGLREWRGTCGPCLIRDLPSLPAYAHKYRSPLYRLYIIEPSHREHNARRE